MMMMHRLSHVMHMVVMMVMVMVMMVVVMHRHRRGLGRVFSKGWRRRERDRQHSGENKLLHRVEFPIYPQERGSQREIARLKMNLT
jgi:hypothetical protein